MAAAAWLFDLDGTLVDSHREIAIALQRAFVDTGLPYDLAQVERMVDGSSLEVIWQRIGRAPGPQYEAFAAAYRSYYLRDIGEHCAVFEGVVATLSRLRRAQPSRSMAVVSNKAAPTVQPLLDALQLSDFFDLAHGRGGTNIAAKPDPELLLRTAQSLQCDPRQCVMVGDTVFDIQAGQRAGMATVAVSYTVQGRDTLLEARPDFLVHRFEQLASVLL